MSDYQREVEDEAEILFNRSFNFLSFDLLKNAIGEYGTVDYIQRPSNEILEGEAKDEFDDEDWKQLSEGEKEEAISLHYSESEHYPMWLTVFEARHDFTSDRIMKNIDSLYSLGIGVIAPTELTNACLFVTGAGYNFYQAHWIPMFESWNWLNVENIEKEAKTRAKRKMVDLQKLKNDKDNRIKRHAKGLIEALNL